MTSRSSIRTVGALALAAGVLSCTDGATAPHRNAARIALAPQLSVDASHIAARLSEFALTVNKVRVTIVRPPAEVLKDTVVDFPANATQLSVELEVALKKTEEQLVAAVELRDNDVVLFAGQRTIVARRGETTGGTDSPVTLSYTGPGNGATSLAIVQRAPAITTGGNIQLTTTVLDATGQPVPGLPLRWTPSDAARLTIDAAGIARSIGLSGTVWAKVESLNGLKDSVQVAITQQASRLSIVSGNNQPAVAGAPLAAPLVVRVLDGLGQAMPGVTVSWHTNGQGSLAVATSTSGQTGDAQNSYTAPTQAGAAPQITAAIAVDSVAFTTATVTGGAATQLAILQQPVATLSGQVLSPAFIIQLRDQYGNNAAQSLVAITASLASGAGITLGGTLASATDINGRATFSNVTLTGTSGAATIGFAATGLTGATSAPITLGVGSPAQIQIVAGNGQKDTVGKQLAQPLQVRVVDAGNNPIQNQAIDWLITSGAASLSAAAQVTSAATQTAADGTTSVPLILGTTAGEVLVQATVHNVALTTTFRDTALAGAANHLALTQQPSSTVQAGVVFPRQPRVQLVDAFGNAVGRSGVPIQIDLYTGGQVCGIAPPGTPTLSLERSAPAPTLSLGGPGAVVAPSRGDPSAVVLGYRPSKVRVQPRAPVAQRAGVRTPRQVTVRPPRLDGHASLTRAQVEAAGAAARSRAATVQSKRTTRASTLAPRQIAPPRATTRARLAPTSPRLASTPTATDFCNYGGVRGTLTANTDATGAVQFTDVRLDIIASTWGLVFSVTGDATLAAVTSSPIVVTPAAPQHLYGYFYSRLSFGDTLQVTQGDTVRGYVYAVDAYGSYVPNVPLSWAPTGGTLDSTSAATDSTGYGRTLWVIPNATGTYALVARSSAIANDSVKAVATTVPQVATYIFPYAGVGQLGTPGQPLDSIYVARVLDQSLRPMAGVHVTWALASGYGTITSATTVSDAAGLVQAQFTPGAGPLGRSDEVTARLDSAGYIAPFYSSVPIANARVFVGRSTASDTSYMEWNDPANWLPAGVPTTADTVWIPGEMQRLSVDRLYWYIAYPRLHAPASVRSLRMESNALMDANQSTLTVLGDVRAYVVTGDSTSRVIVDAPRAHVGGYFPNLTVRQSVFIDTASTSYREVDATWDLDLHGLADLTDASLYAGRNLLVADTAALRMPTGNSYVYVGDTARFAGIASIDFMTAGYIQIGGSFFQDSTMSGASFAPSNAVQTLLYGRGVVDFQSPQQSRFGTLNVQSYYANDTLHFTRPTTVTGDLYVYGNAGYLRADSAMTVYGRLATDGATLAGIPRIDYRGTQFPQVGGPGPRVLRVLNDVASLSYVHDYAGNIVIDTGGVVQMNDSLHLAGNLTVTGPGATLGMAAGSHLVVDSSVVFDGADATNALVGGVLKVRGNFTQLASISPYSYAAGAGHITVFDGTAQQQVSFATGDTLTGSHFGRVWISNLGGGVHVSATNRNYPNVVALGDLEVFDPANLKPSWLTVDTATTMIVRYPASPRWYHAAHVTVNGNLSYIQCYAVQDGSVLVDGANSGQFDPARCTAIPAAASYNAATDFSTTSNPNGVWTSGYTTALGTLTMAYNSLYLDANGTPGYDRWTTDATNFYDFRRKTVTSSAIWALGQAALTPGCAGEYSLIRWTAPSAGSYDVNVRFYAGDTAETSGYVLRNGSALFSTAATSTQPSYATTLLLAQGDSIDVAVGAASGACVGTLTPIDFAVTQHVTPIGAPAPIASRASRN